MNSKQEEALRMCAERKTGIISPRSSMNRQSWYNPATATLDALVRRGYMEKVGWAAYRITNAGRAVIVPPEGTFDFTEATTESEASE